MVENILSREYLLKPSDSNANRELPATLLISQIIEVATDHANMLGIGFLHLEPRGLGWVLSRVTVEMTRWPKTGDKYTVKTWIESWNRHFSERCFSVTASDGEIIGYVRTVWVIIDLVSHNSVGTASIELDSSKIEGGNCPIPRPLRHRPFEAEKKVEYKFKYTDLDFYRHVNTVRYISLLLNQFSLEDFDTHILSRFDVSFLHESRYGQTATIGMIEEEVESPLMISGVNPNKSKRRFFDVRIDGQPIIAASMTLTPHT